MLYSKKKEFNSTQNQVKRKSYMPSIYRLKIKLLTKNPRANEEGTSMEFVSIVDKTPIGTINGR